MFTVPELIGLIAAVIAVVCVAIFLRRFVGGVEDNMNEMRESERVAPQVKPVRQPGVRRRR